MNIYDWVVVAVVLAFAVRGWFRGFVRELVDVAILVAGTALLFRLSAAVGTILSAMANIPYEAARVAAGTIMLVVLFVGATLVANLVTGSLRILPGATVLNHLGGAGAGVVYAGVAVVLVTTVLGVSPMPAGVRTSLDEAIGTSTIGRTVTDPGGRVQMLLGTASGESLFATVLAVRQTIGDRLGAGTIPLPLPSVDRSELVSAENEAMIVLDELNVARVAAGENPLAWSPELSVVATNRAKRVYQSGHLSLDDRLASDLTGASVPGTINSEGVVIAASPSGIAEAILSTPPYREAIENPDHRKVGIGVVNGPYGRVAVFIASA